MNFADPRKASNVRAFFFLALGLVMAGTYGSEAVQAGVPGRFVMAIGWLAVGLAQGYQSLFEMPVTARNASERARAHYRLARFVTLFAFPTILIGIAMR
ncbi:MAG TPA: hypothetical protein VNU21_16055 [Usitatibacter sp.]|jgi:hypothetical protein|nr:hypothetical protein [Usitatibacter sp.]